MYGVYVKGVLRQCSTRFYPCRSFSLIGYNHTAYAVSSVTVHTNWFPVYVSPYRLYRECWSSPYSSRTCYCMLCCYSVQIEHDSSSPLLIIELRYVDFCSLYVEVTSTPTKGLSVNRTRPSFIGPRRFVPCYRKAIFNFMNKRKERQP